MIKSGAIAEMNILEDIDLNAIAKQGAEMIGLYKANAKNIKHHLIYFNKKLKR